MSKQSGLGDALYVAGRDISGDVGALGSIKQTRASKVVTGLDKSAVERMPLLYSGELAFTGWWDTATDMIHDALKSLPDASMLVTYCRGKTAGNAAANLWAKQATYNVPRDEDGSIAVSADFLSDAYGLEWCVQLTAGAATIASAANGTGVDLGNAPALPVNITSNSVANPTHVITTTPHGLVTGDSCTIAGHTSTPTINGDWPVTRINDTEFTVPVNVTVGGGANGTVQKTSTNYGAALYVQVLSFGSNAGTVKVQHSADNGVADTWADIAGMISTSKSARSDGERIASTSATAIVKRYVRPVYAGTFTNMVICASFLRYPAA